jgi:phosphoribosylanthranilate isomerase
MVKVKICGITNLEDAQAACAAGADALGFVLAPEAKKRNRHIAFEDARAILEEVPPFVTTVAVCVNESIATLARYLTVFDMVQLHGEERPEEVPMKQVSIKAFRAGPGFVLDDMRAYDARAYLLDALVPGERGGTGALADWNLAKEAVAMETPIILAGGLDPDNVAKAVRAVQPYGVDASGGLESEPGKKDHERIREFIHQAKASLA